MAEAFVATPIATPTVKKKAQDQPFFINNTKIANQIRKGAAAGEPISCQVFGTVSTVYQLSHQLSAFDCSVADAIYTLYKSGRETFTPGAVLKVLSGDHKQTVTVQKKNRITDSIRRLRETTIRICCTEEMRARERIAPDDEKVMDGPFLAVRDEGKDEYRFEGMEGMPLYHYGELTMQMIRFPGELFSELGIDSGDYGSTSAWKHRCDRVCETVMKTLEYYKGIGYIADYRERGGGSVEIRGKVEDPWELHD